jgi:UDP-N-acetylmuramyl pentapeptide synthase
MPLLRQEAVMVSIDHYRNELVAQLGRAALQGRIDILTNAAELYRSLAKSPQTAQEMARCCDAMQAEMKPGDILLVERSNGAGMTVRYLLPRAS